MKVERGKIQAWLQGKRTWFVLLLLATVLYCLHFRLAFPIVALMALAAYLPMPKLINSWFSRLLFALLFLYALLQLSALVQLLALPNSGFNILTGITAVLTIGLLALFGRTIRPKQTKLMGIRDWFVVAGCLFFLLPFVPIIAGSHSVTRVASVAGVQVSDSVAHYSSILNFAQAQNFGSDYKSGRYYPSGFHIATAYMETSVVGAAHKNSWNANVLIYFGQYLFFGVLLCAVLIYFGQSWLARLSPDGRGVLPFLAVSLAIGIGATIMHLLLFVSEGFINYYYVCATLIAASLYFIDPPVALDLNHGFEQNKPYVWPLAAYLLLGLGASLSWPLLVPPILLSVLCVLAYPKWRVRLPALRKYLQVHLLIGFLAVCNLAAMLLQVKYMPGNQQLLNMPGAIHNFNVIFLLIGAAVAAVALYRNAQNTARTLTAIFLPYFVLVLGLMLYQFFTLGEASYYLIKSAMLLEMLLVVFLAAELTNLFYNGQLPGLPAGLFAITLSLFVVVGSMDTVSQPFVEVRSIFRNAAGMGKPPFLDSDVRSVVSLGSQNKIAGLNVTILHYDAAGQRFYAQIETALWAQALANNGTHLLNDIVGSRSTSCFGRQFSLLAYAPFSKAQQADLLKATNDCIALAQQHKETYYIVTDGGSVEALKGHFGNKVTYVTD
jgi:hypothetical protein